MKALSVDKEVGLSGSMHDACLPNCCTNSLSAPDRLALCSTPAQLLTSCLGARSCGHSKWSKHSVLRGAA